MRVDNSPRPMKSKTIMALPDRPQRLQPPLIRRASEVSLWFADREDEMISFNPRRDRNEAFRTIVPERVRK